MRYIENADIVGRTIKSIDVSTNMIKLEFADGGSLELWSEIAVYTNDGVIPGIFVDNVVPASHNEQA